MKYFVTSRLSENISETPEGYLVCIGVPIARTGEMIYAKGELPELEADAEGKIVVDRPEKEVFRPETMASFEGKAFTIQHPEKFVDPTNWSDLAKGTMQNIRRGEGQNSSDLMADLLITEAEAIKLVKGGMRELSCGYDANYVQTGVGRYTQTFIVGNHLALVDEGRAGPAYAINDHKGKVTQMPKLADKIKAIFAKAQDEAMKMAEDEAAPADKEKKPVEDAMSKSYDELVKMVKDLGEKVGAMMPKNKDAVTPPSDDEPAVATDAEVAPSIEDRMKALEAQVAKLLQGQSMDEESDEVTDADGEEESEESEDDDFDESTMTGDTASRLEILAPGMKYSKDDKSLKGKALIAAYATRDGKKVIDSLTGSKAPDIKAVERNEALFVAVSELLKRERNADLAKTKTRDSADSGESNGSTQMTPEMINEKNKKFYAR